MRKFKFNSLSLWIALVGVAVFAVGSVSFATSGLVNNYYGNTTVNQSGSEIGDTTFGASVDESTYLTNERPATVVPFENIFVKGDVEIGGSFYFSGNAIQYGTTTPSDDTLFKMVSLDLTGTSTAKGVTQNVVAYYTNTGADKFIDWVGIDQVTANASFASSYQCGTSTWVGGIVGGSITATTSAGVIASTTVATTLTTMTYGGPLDVEDLHGSALAEDKTKFVLQNNEVLFCTWTPYAATSSASFTSSGGFTGVGNLLIKLFGRGN